MATVISRHTSALGLPGLPVALGGVELQPGANQVDDKAWAGMQDNTCVQAWLASGLLEAVLPPAAPADVTEEASKKRGR